MTTKSGMATAPALGVALAAQLGFAPVAQGADTAAIERLERTIQEQQRQLDALKQQLQELKQSMTQTRETTPPVAKAKEQPGVVQSGQDRVKLTVSGQVNRGVLWMDDGREQEVFHVDNDNSSTRILLIGQGQVSEDFALGTQIETDIKSNSTSDVNQNRKRDTDSVTFTERKLELYLDSKRLGRLWLGQGDTASNVTSEVDLSATAVIGYSDIERLAGGLLFRHARTGELTDIRIKDVFDNLDGLSRDDRLRYDTPSLAGFRLSTSAVADDRWDVALRFGGDFGPFKAAAAIGYAEPRGATDYRLNGSASVLHTSGFNLTIAAGKDQPKSGDRDEPSFWYVKAGYIAKLFQFGKTAFAIDYAGADNVKQDDDELRAYGAFVVQNLEAYGTEFYLGLRNHELDRPGTPTDDILATLAGVRVKF